MKIVPYYTEGKITVPVDLEDGQKRETMEQFDPDELLYPAWHYIIFDVLVVAMTVVVIYFSFQI